MIISVSGKIGSGKDTVGKIIQILTGSPQLNIQGVASFLNGEYNNPTFHIKKFADTLKNQVCGLIGCTRTDLEDHDFKNTELSEDWWYYKIRNGVGEGAFELISYIDNDLKGSDLDICNDRYLVKPTPRMLLQQIGTDLFRNQLHPNVWVNALFSKYKSGGFVKVAENVEVLGNFPNWIITDMRFPNELKAVKDRGGITIRVERQVDENNRPIIRENEHESETALDAAGFDYLIHNNGSIQTLIYEVKEILILEKII